MTYSFENTAGFADAADKADPLAQYRSRFLIPQHEGKDCIYFTGNSLGLQPRSAKGYIEEELKKWHELGVDGHFHAARRPWYHYHKYSKESLARIVGAAQSEVVAMNNLTSNLHLMMVSFYRPSATRFKIIVEANAFPSDRFALASQVKFHGHDPESAIVTLKPREGEYTLRTEDIISTIEAQGEELALVMMGGVQYYTGQFFNLKAITEAAHCAGAFAGFDLAHAVGNVPLQLHDDGVDFAVWCSYKYLNSGPGGVSGIFVHEKHGQDDDIPRFAGWWGHDEQERFQMKAGFRPMPGADGWQVSNGNVLSAAAHLAALELFDEVGMTELRKKSLQLTAYLEYLLRSIGAPASDLEIITPSSPEERGCQLSLFVNRDGQRIFENISKAGVVADWREPNAIRVAPVPLYNSFKDVYIFVKIIKDSLSLQS